MAMEQREGRETGTAFERQKRPVWRSRGCSVYVGRDGRMAELCICIGDPAKVRGSLLSQVKPGVKQFSKRRESSVWDTLGAFETTARISSGNAQYTAD